jgi:hypothetical protein
MRRYAALAGLGSLVAALLLVGGPVSGASAATTLTPTVEAIRQVSAGGSTQRLWILPQLAVDPANANTIVLADGNYRDGGCSLFTSTNGGITWSNPTNSLLPSGFMSCIARPDTEPQVAPKFSPDGKTLYVAMDGTPMVGQQHGPISLSVATSTDLGLNSTAKVVFQSTNLTGATSAGATASRPAEFRSASLAVDPTDPSRIYVGSERGTDSLPSSIKVPEQPAVAVSTNGGSAWGAETDLGVATQAQTGGPYNGYTPVLMVGKDGTVYAVAEGVATDSGGSMYPMYLYKSTDHGSHWTASTIAKDQSNTDEPAAAIDPASGAIYVAWDSATSNMTEDISLTRSTDGGKTWSKPVSIVPPAVSSVSDRYFPGLSVAPNGRVDVTWLDFRNDPFHPTGSMVEYSDTYYAYSTDKGATWSNDIRITPRSIDQNLGVAYADFNVETGAVASTNNAALLAWPQPAAGAASFQAEDDYFTRVDLTGSVEPLRTTAKNHDVAWGVGGLAIGLAVTGLVLLVLSMRRGRATA